MTDLPLFDLRSYPTELLAAILSIYCDINDILNLWFAAVGNQEYADLLWPLLVNNTVSKLKLLLKAHIYQQPLQQEFEAEQQSKSRKRRCLPACLQTLIKDELESKIDLPYRPVEFLDTTSEFERQRYRTRRLCERMALIAYHENLYGVLWCGHMEFSIPQNVRSFREQKLMASVKLCCYGDFMGDGDNDHYHHHHHPVRKYHVDTSAQTGGCEKELKSWSFVNLRAWNTCFPEWLSSVQLRSQLYNFVPIPPYGRLQGISKEDKDAIRKVRLALEGNDQVMTLVIRNKRLILRVISPQQARRRLSQFPTLAGKFELLAAAEGLLCCWERTELWEDELKLGYLSKEERLGAVASLLARYQSCLKPCYPNNHDL